MMKFSQNLDGGNMGGTAENVVLTVLGVAAFVVLILAVPAVFLWSINSLAAAGGSSFYIEHTLGNYFVSLVFLVLFNTSTVSTR